MNRRNRKRSGDHHSGASSGRHRNSAQNRREKSSSAKEAEGQKGNNRQSKANMVVLVDDDPAYVEMESLGVVNYIPGYNPMGFTAAGRALNYITNPRNTGRIGLVLLNFEMPQADGRSTNEILNFLAKHRDIPLALVSSHNTAQNVERVRKLGAVGFLPKAFTMEVFVHFVKDILRKGGSSAWQCVRCGKLVPVDRIDMLNLGPIKCSDKNCESSELKKIHFGAQKK